jgi:hypothetical protein
VDEGVHFMRNDEVVEAGEKEGSPPKDMVRDEDSAQPYEGQVSSSEVHSLTWLHFDFVQVTFSFKSTEDDGDKRIDNFLKKGDH